jgi:hypothetical protein
MLSGCGAVKNLEDSGSKTVPTPKDHSVVWFGHHFSEDTAKAIKISIVALCYGLVCGYVGDYMKKDCFDNKIFYRSKSKEIIGSIPKVVQNPPLPAMDDVD